MLATACWTDTDSWLQAPRPRRSGCLSQRGCARIPDTPSSHLGSKNHQFLGASRAQFRASHLRRSATRRTAPSVATAPGCGKPVRVSRETKVASQHSAAKGRGAVDYQVLPVRPNHFPSHSHPSPFHYLSATGEEAAARCMPRRVPRKHPLVRRTPGRARSGRSGAGVRGANVGAAPPAWLGVPRSWRAQRALPLARLPQPANAEAQRRRRRQGWQKHAVAEVRVPSSRRVALPTDCRPKHSSAAGSPAKERAVSVSFCGRPPSNEAKVSQTASSCNWA